MLENRSLRRDLFALVLIALAAFLALALSTYDPADPPSRLTFPLRSATHNVCGPAGAYAAHALLEGFGLGAYYLAGSLGALAVLLLLGRGVDQLWLRVFGWVVSLIGVTSLMAMAVP